MFLYKKNIAFHTHQSSQHQLSSEYFVEASDIDSQSVIRLDAWYQTFGYSIVCIF